ncbi:hypothetical protein UK12_35700, partial [Saccharothrix sp. ST-888]
WKPVTDGGAGALSGTWLVAIPAGCAEDAAVLGMVRMLAGRGVDVRRVELDGADRCAVAESLRQALADGSPVSGVLSLLALDGTVVES